VAGVAIRLVEMNQVDRCEVSRGLAGLAFRLGMG